MLKEKNLAVLLQLPAKVLESRKPLYPVFKKAKAETCRIKFVLDKVYDNGKECVPPESPNAVSTMNTD